MKIINEKRLDRARTVLPGDRLIVEVDDGEKKEILLDTSIDESMEYNTVFAAKLDPGENGFSHGLVGGVAQKDDAEK